MRKLFPHTNEALAREQYRTLTRLMPILYSVIFIVTVGLQAGFYNTAPDWLIWSVPPALLLVVVARAIYWFKARKLVDTTPLPRIRRDMVATAIIGPVLALGFSYVGLALMERGDVAQQALALMSIWVVAIASSFCLYALPLASVTVIISATVPLIFGLADADHPVVAFLPPVLAIVAALIIFMLVQMARTFREIVQSRSTIDETRQQAEEARERATELAYTDALTGLANRRGFDQLLSSRGGALNAAGTTFLVAMLDLDGFKPINDIHGHATGDIILAEVARRLHAAAGPDATVARMGGDEFAVFAEGIASEEDALAFGARLAAVFETPFAAESINAQLKTSIGLTMGGDASVSVSKLIERADNALYRAKAVARGEAVMFTPDLEETAHQRASIEQELRAAVAARAFEVHFQPIVQMPEGRVTGFEALARWTHPELGVIPPSVFIPISEQSGQIAEVNDILLEKAVAYAARWPSQFKLAFNLSAEQVMKPSAGLRVLKILADAGFDPRRFEAEVTETAMMRDFQQAQRTIDNLRAAGVRIALDDFGTGYSSFGHLRRFSVDKLKIDKSFVDDIVHDGKAANLLRGILSMSQSLDVACIAEGIESDEQYKLLCDIGCTSGQGYFMSRPVPASAVGAIIGEELRGGNAAQAAA